jgi:hypothetical protein
LTTRARVNIETITIVTTSAALKRLAGNFAANRIHFANLIQPAVRI